MTETTCTLSPHTLIQDLLNASRGLSGAAIRMLLVHAKECLQTGGDSTLTLEESARLAGISLSSAQKSLRTLAQVHLVRRLRFGRNTHVRVLCISGLSTRGQEPLPLEDPTPSSLAVNTQRKTQPDDPPLPDPQHQQTGKITDPEERLRELESQKKKVHEAWIKASQDGASPAEALKLSAQYSQLCTSIERLKQHKTRKETVHVGLSEAPKEERTKFDARRDNGPRKEELPSPPPRELPDHLGARIRSTIRQVPGISSPTQVFNEIRHQVCAGLFRGKDLLHATNICLKLLREGRWTTPWDYPQKTEAMM